MHASPLLMGLAYSEATMTDRPITRIISAEQALGICRAPIVGPDQRTLLDAQPPAMPAQPLPALPVPCSAAVPPALMQHTAEARYGTHTPQSDAHRLRPDQATMLDGVPASIMPAPPAATLASTQPTLVPVHPPSPPAPVALPLPPPAAMIRRGRAIAVAVLASLGAALVAGGIVAALYERAAGPAPLPANEPTRDALLQPRR
jgi:hypothetical protein